MAFAGAATGAPAQSEGMTALGPSFSGTKLPINKLGVKSLSPGAAKAVEKNPYKAVVVAQANAKGALLAGSVNRSVPKVQRPAALSYKAPAGLNASAATAVDQPITLKSSAVQSSTGVNAYQQEQFGGYQLEPPDPSLCAGQGFVVQVVNQQLQISNQNLQKLSAPMPLEGFFGNFIDPMFDPLCSYNHSTGKWYITNAVSDFASFSGVFIAVSTSSDPRSPYNIYFLDLTNFGGDGFCAVGFCLADQPNLGSDQFTISISTNQFELNGVLPSGGQFAGAAYVLIDKFALALGAPAPNVVAFDIGVSPGIFPDFAFGDCVNGNIVGAPGPCWYSIQPADAANGRYDTRNNGTEWAMSALDFFGAGDDRIATWQFVNTSSIGAFIPNITGFLRVLSIGHTTYSPPPLSAQPQAPTGPNTANGNPLGDFAVLIGICPPGTPPAGCSNPGPIDSGDDRMRDTMMTTTTTGARVMWGGLGTATGAANPCGCIGGGGQAGVMYFGLNLGAASVGLAAQWTIHNPTNDLQFPSVSIMDNGLALGAYSVSGPALRPSSAYSVFSTTMAPAAIQIANQGLGVQDGFTQYNDVFTSGYRPRWGDYSGAATMGNSIYFTTEFIPAPNCSLAAFIVDDTCGGTRSFAANWGTSLNKATQVPHP
jgi:hypothetical protein